MVFEPVQDRVWQFVAGLGGAGDQWSVAAAAAADHQDVIVWLASGTVGGRPEYAGNGP